MPHEHHPQHDPHRGVYQIRLKGHLGREWAQWFDGLTIALEDNGETLIAGSMDQATLHGVLKKVRDLGMPLLAVNPVAA
ncbi:MAG: hypothetical protein HC822_15265 [Oscillochloris sp.]|nr:hypothetical protein [Oscillochloris sp.]